MIPPPVGKDAGGLFTLRPNLSMTTALRALIMLAFLVGLPAAWIYYGPLPDRAQRTVDRLIREAKTAVGWHHSDPARATGFATRQQRPAAPGFAAAPPRPGLVEAGREAGDGAAAKKANPLAARLEPLLARLRELGVAGYALERWGNGGQWYRFRCEMPLAASAATQQFEAVAVDPQATVEQVVAEVSSWRLAQQSGGPIR